MTPPGRSIANRLRFIRDLFHHEPETPGKKMTPSPWTVIHADDENTMRTVTVAVGRSGGETAVNLTFTRK